MMSAIDKHEPAPKPGRERVYPVLVKLIEQRVATAEKEHGTPLETHNGRDALMDAMQEQIDALMYMVQAYIEREDRK